MTEEEFDASGIEGDIAGKLDLIKPGNGDWAWCMERIASLVDSQVAKERERIIRLIEDEQAFLTAGDKMMLRELIHDSAEPKPAVESCAACGGPLTKWPGGAMACETCHNKATLL